MQEVVEKLNRMKEKMTIASIARVTGISAPTIYKIMSGSNCKFHKRVVNAILSASEDEAPKTV